MPLLAHISRQYAAAVLSTPYTTQFEPAKAVPPRRLFSTCIQYIFDYLYVEP